MNYNSKKNGYILVIHRPASIEKQLGHRVGWDLKSLYAQ